MVNGVDADDAARLLVRGEHLSREQETFLKEYIAEVQECAEIDDHEVAEELDPEVREQGVLDWGWVQGILSVLQQRSPGASGAGIALFADDIYQYLHKPGMRRAVTDRVRAAFRPGVETVVVAYSLGTVVAYDLLKQSVAEHEPKVPMFVTLGSPLAVNVVKKALRPIEYPTCVADWFNAVDDRDLVALLPLDADNFEVEPAIKNKTDIDNPTPEPAWYRRLPRRSRGRAPHLRCRDGWLSLPGWRPMDAGRASADVGFALPDRMPSVPSLFVLSQYLLPKRAITAVGGRGRALARRRRDDHADHPLVRRRYGVDMGEAADPDIASYASFNAFFTRALQPGVRPLAACDLVCPVDGAISQFGAHRRRPDFPGQGPLLLDHRAGRRRRRAGGAVRARHFATLYLSPKDYHRIHMPCAGG